jgi:hypothetical protein
LPSGTELPAAALTSINFADQIHALNIPSIRPAAGNAPPASLAMLRATFEAVPARGFAQD